jgi:dTDP-4-amino-4,6-dideoxygalactose transaminase
MTGTLLCRCCPRFFNRLSGIFNPFPDRSRCSFCAFLDRLASLVGGLFDGFFGLLDRALILRPNEAEREHCKDDKREFSHKKSSLFALTDRFLETGWTQFTSCYWQFVIPSTGIAERFGLHRSVGARYLANLEISKGVTNVPFLDLRRQYLPLREDILSEIAALCDQQNFILGAQVEELEQKIAALTGTAYGIGTSSGTDAQLLILMSLGIGPGDAVLTTPFTFFSTAGCISRVGATPIFIDIDPDTFALSPERLEEFLVKRCVSSSTGVKTSDGKRVCAVVPVHLFGMCVDMHSILQLAAQWNLPVIEDAAQAIGAKFSSPDGVRSAGGVGLAGFFSFYPTKNLGAFGDAGMVVTNDSRLAGNLRILRNHGMEPKYYHRQIGGNFRLDALQAAVLLKKLPHLSAWSNRRWEIAQKYRETLADLSPDLLLPVEPYRESCGPSGHIFHQFVIRTKHRNALRAKLQEVGIGTEIYYPLALHQQDCFRHLGYRKGEFPEAECAAQECLALPIFPELTQEEIDLVTGAIRTFFEKRHV